MKLQPPAPQSGGGGGGGGKELEKMYVTSLMIRTMLAHRYCAVLAPSKEAVADPLSKYLL